MNPKDITPDEISQSQTNLVWVHLHEISRDVKIIETESKIDAVRGWEVEEEEEEEEEGFSEQWTSVLQDEKYSQGKWWWWLHNNMNVLKTTGLYS